MIHNRHEREISASVGEVGMLIDSLAGKNDRLWPRNAWPAMRMDAPLGVGAAGGHGPVRYFVTHYEPGRRVEFQFTKPAGFKGRHSFTAVSLSKNSTLLRHELSMSPSGTALFTWPLFFRPPHDALIEESLDLAENECSSSPGPAHRRSPWTRILRAPFPAAMANKRNIRRRVRLRADFEGVLSGRCPPVGSAGDVPAADSSTVRPLSAARAASRGAGTD